MEVNVLVWGKGEGGSVDERPAANSVWCRSARAAHVGSRHICGAQLRATFARKHSGRRSIVDRFSERRRGMARRTRLSWRSRGNPKGRYCRKRFWRAHTSRHGRYANAVEGRVWAEVPYQIRRNGETFTVSVVTAPQRNVSSLDTYLRVTA